MTENTGWLGHIPIIPPGDFPGAPATFTYQTGHANDDGLYTFTDLLNDDSLHVPDNLIDRDPDGLQESRVEADSRSARFTPGVEGSIWTPTQIDASVRDRDTQSPIIGRPYPSRTPGQRSSARSTPFDHDAEALLAQKYVGTKRRRDAFDTERIVSNAQAAPTTLRQRKRAKRERAEVVPEESVIEPGREFTKLYNEAIDSFLHKKDYEEAQQLAVRAIAANPEVFAAHNLLADIYHAMDDDETAMDVLMTGAHGHMNNVELWRQVAEKILGDFGVFHQNRIERAIYCFSAILRKDPEDTSARFQRAELARELGNWNRAYSDLEIILEQDPHNSKIMSIFKQVCYDVNDIRRAREAYQEYFRHYEEEGIPQGEYYTWEDVGNYMDLIADSDPANTSEAIAVGKRLARILAGRGQEEYWDLYTDDDREIDQLHLPRRLNVPQFDDQLFSEDMYGEAIPLDLRAKIGILRLRSGDREEALSHFAWLDISQIEEQEIEVESFIEQYSDTLFDIAKAFYSVKSYDKALDYFLALHRQEIDLGFRFWSVFGSCAYIGGEKDLAVKCYENAIEHNPEAIDERTQLSKLHRDLGDRTKALKYGRQAVQMAQDIALASGGRKYERRDDRIAREQAENTLRRAYKMPKGNTKKAGKVPLDLRARRGRGTVIRYIPRDTTAPRESPAQSTSMDNSAHIPTSARTFLLEGSPPRERRKRANQNADKIRKDGSAKNENAHDERFRVTNLYQTLLESQESMREGDELATNTWMDCAEALLKEHFVTLKAFFPPERRKFTGLESDYIARNETSDVFGARAESVSTIRLAEPESPDTFHDISFASWLDIFLELALLQAQIPSATASVDCYATIRALTDCTIFYHHSPSMTQIYVVYLCCTLYLQDEPTLYNIVLRWFMREFAFCTDTFRLYSAITLAFEAPLTVRNANLGVQSNIRWKSSENQKFIFRQITAIDRLLPADYAANNADGPVPAFMHRPRDEHSKYDRSGDSGRGMISSAPSASHRDIDSPTTPVHNPPLTSSTQSHHSPSIPADTDPSTTINTPVDHALTRAYRPQQMDVVLFTLYAHIMMASGSYPNALNYLYRAHALCPDDPVMLLSMALCYMHQMFKRQMTNRHLWLLDGWAWFGEYERARLQWAERMVKKCIEQGRSREESEEVVRLVKEEISFNRARCWMMLGCADLSVRDFERVLESSESRKKSDGGMEKTDLSDNTGQSVSAEKGTLVPEDEPVQTSVQLEEANADKKEAQELQTWNMEAAYALVNTYAVNGNTAKAREITERYLVV